jgi:5-methylcytosine-specific restriction protein A
VLLFTTREPTAREVREVGNHGKRFRFRGEFNVLDYHFERASKGIRSGQLLIKFNLVRVGGARFGRENSSMLSDAMRDSAASLPPEDVDSMPAPIAERIGSYRVRSSLTRQQALKRANGMCEGCLAPAPFLGTDGVPFLEVHHIHRLADDGPDVSRNVAALCPNCHRRAHYSLDKDDYRQYLSAKIRDLELLREANC